MHVVRVYVRYGSLGESRECEFFEATDPLTRVLGVLPLGPLQLEDLTGDCLEGHRRRPLPATLGKRVTTGAGRTSIGQRRVARLRQRHERISSKPELVPLSPRGCARTMPKDGWSRVSSLLSPHLSPHRSRTLPDRIERCKTASECRGFVIPLNYRGKWTAGG